jgi:succinate dehydrogenase hydrophobic anchor subunit
MKSNIIKSYIEAPLIKWLKKIPRISLVAETRGWFYLISWSHRITGIFLVISLWVYLYGFHALQASRYSFILALSLWMVAIPMAFHGFNGARLILYELFGNRNDDAMIRSVFALSLLYVIVLGLLMLMGNQMVSPFLLLGDDGFPGHCDSLCRLCEDTQAQTFSFMEDAENYRILSPGDGTGLFPFCLATTITGDQGKFPDYGYSRAFFDGRLYAAATECFVPCGLRGLVGHE